MANDFRRRSRSGGQSTPKFHVLWSKQNIKSSTLPPLGQASIHTKSKTKTLTKVQSAVFHKPSVLMTNPPKGPEDLHQREKFNPRKTHAKVRFMRAMLRNQRSLLQEMCHHKHFLSKLSDELVRAIQDTEQTTALSVRAMLQQQDTLTSIIDILECSNRKRLQQLKSELEDWEHKEESKISSLVLQVEQLNAKVQKTQEEVNFLSTYMDHEYPVRSVHIANLARQLQQAKDDQQDELDNLSEMRRMVLESLSNKILEKKKKILRSLAKRTLHPHEEALLHKVQDSQLRQRGRSTVTEFIEGLKERLPVLRTEAEELRAQMQDPREVVFKDVLLWRPKCTPDMDVILNLPEEELLPF
ncbi:uncharacterized protein C20orf96 homolog isoform X3 [Sciurus carolinensis]|uniref:uncharacterized protein C20orf96 homolog isoform X3 n=1 Tax=Sciurus carolinensis TaxID=30640 RepID=UPI001FB51EEF|nr:uncharacterized protein C20orf96 homolog isoform X3 [Sciurus carolinensis]